MVSYGINQTGFSVGMSVRVIRQNKYRKYNLIDKIGIVQYAYCASSIAVAFDGITNDLSEKGVFYFSAADLTIVEEKYHDRFKEENKMSNSNITNYFNAIKVKFIDDGNVSRHVYANFEDCIEVGDLVVVKPAHHDVALARVEEILPDNTYETTREVIAKVDTTYYKQRVEAREKIAKVKAQMQERAKKLQDIALYQMLAKDDPEMAQLLADYQSLPQY